ncbi:GDP-mannose mannosyl hydrolase [Providencia rettgeri]|uniref:GDP-mannose mannosyl hydrolase n=1 Tax=Providencia TaxID=586 RepID=UPI0011836F94|nr:GDP-mannose mannosyl hydrolase [Providencia rettgeri]EMA4783426.1 GDP-mannose mannosyl hydrolase [Providencia rettgeri]MCG9952029.1 GDP-mannose mannosyl hydrolase [Providencia rettgeri]MDU7495539.1 GDP-mannose mannosyl hydrolase [Providencia rettgeri]HEM8308104.1 GDP-mannose mannosyl hydrolase [Providencia rettgeri]
MAQRLSLDTFKTIVASTPLVSIDLVICNSKNQALLGQRNNRPAQGYWFVPGGRICKDETFDIAFQRLTINELGINYNINNSKFIGHYQHLYQDNFSDDNFSTHYVVLGYFIKEDLDLNKLPLEQHRNYQWWNIDELLNSSEVHDNTKAYFINNHLSLR